MYMYQLLYKMYGFLLLLGKTFFLSEAKMIVIMVLKVHLCPVIQNSQFRLWKKRELNTPKKKKKLIPLKQQKSDTHTAKQINTGITWIHGCVLLNMMNYLCMNVDINMQNL